MASEMAKGRALVDRHGKHLSREGIFSISLAQALLKGQSRRFIFLWVTKDILCGVLEDIKIFWVNFNLTYVFHELRIFHFARLFFFFNYLLNLHSSYVNLVAFLFVCFRDDNIEVHKGERMRKDSFFSEHLLCARHCMKHFYIHYFILVYE